MTEPTYVAVIKGSGPEASRVLWSTESDTPEECHAMAKVKGAFEDEFTVVNTEDLDSE